MLIGVCALLDAVDQCCELAHRRSQRRARKQNNKEKSEWHFQKLQSTQSTCRKMKDSCRHNSCCVADRHSGDTTVTWWFRLTLSVAESMYIILFVLHTRSSQSASFQGLNSGMSLTSIL